MATKVNCVLFFRRICRKINTFNDRERVCTFFDGQERNQREVNYQKLENTNFPVVQDV